jgi:hypothetical protein
VSGRCEKIGERQKYERAVILSEAKNLALSSFAISHFHRQSEILRFAQDDSEGLRTTGWLIFSHLPGTISVASRFRLPHRDR